MSREIDRASLLRDSIRTLRRVLGHRAANWRSTFESINGTKYESPIILDWKRRSVNAPVKFEDRERRFGPRGSPFNLRATTYLTACLRLVVLEEKETAASTGHPERERAGSSTGGDPVVRRVRVDSAIRELSSAHRAAP